MSWICFIILIIMLKSRQNNMSSTHLMPGEGVGGAVFCGGTNCGGGIGSDRPLGGFGLTTGDSSSEELSSEAPRMNLRRALPAASELNLGLLALLPAWVLADVSGWDVCFRSGCILDEVAPGWGSAGVDVERAVALWVRTAFSSPAVEEAAGTVAVECSASAGERVASSLCMSCSATAALQPGWDSSSFSGISLALTTRHSNHGIRRFNIAKKNCSIQRHPLVTAVPNQRREKKNALSGLKSKYSKPII